MLRGKERIRLLLSRPRVNLKALDEAVEEVKIDANNNPKILDEAIHVLEERQSDPGIGRAIKKISEAIGRYQKNYSEGDESSAYLFKLRMALEDRNDAIKFVRKLARQRSLTHHESWFIEEYYNRYDPP